MVAPANRDNVVGACIFWAYIVAALTFTGIICNDLIILYHKAISTKPPKQKAKASVTLRNDQVWLFLALSLLSFAVLSYHMLNFLVISYAGWAQLQDIDVPRTLTGKQGVYDFGQRTFRIQPWQWSRASTLFQDFATIICDDPSRFWWTQQALLYSFGWNMFMSIKGRQYQMPHLWVYFVLDQILPVSFTQNLFCTALLITPHPLHEQYLIPAPQLNQYVIASLYLASVWAAPTLVTTSWLFSVLFATRALLFAPLLFLAPTMTTGKAMDHNFKPRSYNGSRKFLLASSLLLQFYQTWQAAPLSSALEAIHDSPAVAALGYDYIIAVRSLLAYTVLTR